MRALFANLYRRNPMKLFPIVATLALATLAACGQDVTPQSGAAAPASTAAPQPPPPAPAVQPLDVGDVLGPGADQQVFNAARSPRPNEKLAVDLAAMADAHDVHDKALVAHAGTHAPIAYAVHPVTGPCAKAWPSLRGSSACRSLWSMKR